MGKQKTLEELLEIVRRKESSEDPVEVAKRAKKAKKDKLLWENLGVSGVNYPGRFGVN